LSLQSHTGRAELWIVIDDGAVIHVGEQERAYQAGARDLDSCQCKASLDLQW